MKQLPAGRPTEFLSERRDHSFSDEWYDVATDTHFWLEWRRRVLLRALAERGLDREKPLSVLDVGGGCGIIATQLERNTNWTVDTADLDEAALARCAQKRGRILYYDVLERRPELRERYDAALLMDVLEHVPNPTEFAAAAAAHVKPGGLISINVPALESCRSRFDDAVGHLRRYSKKTLRMELQSLPLEAIDLRYWGLTLVPLLVARKALMLVRSAETNVIDAGFKPPDTITDALLRAIGRIEPAVITKPPIGTSLLLTARTRNS